MMRDESWREHAACAGHNPRWWFPEGGTPSIALEALAVCAGCAVRTECLTHAMTQPERYGIWGGMTETEREKASKRRRIS